MFNLDKAKKNLKNTVMATVATVAMAAPAFGAENKKAPVKEDAKIEAVTEKTTETASVETPEFAAERIAQIKSLESKLHVLKIQMQELEGKMNATESDFSSAVASAEEFTGSHQKKHSENVSLLPSQIRELAVKMGREQVAKHDVTTEDAANGLAGILLSQGGRFGPSVAYLNQLMSGQIGSTIAMNGEKASEDMVLHKKLGTDPKIMVTLALKYVDLEHKASLVQEELNDLIAAQEVASN
jgi:hypothetical protein